MTQDISEDRRLAVLRRLAILDTDPEPAFDGLVHAARVLFDTPMAMVSLVDKDRQWFKAGYGLDCSETARGISFCTHAIARPDDVMVVLDAAADPFFRDNALVTGEPHIRFYAGARLIVDGQPVGTLCIADQKPRAAFGPEERAKLLSLAAPAQALLQIRLETEARRTLARSLEFQARKLAMAEQMAGLGHWTMDVETGAIVWSDEVYRIHGVDRSSFDPQLEGGLGFYTEESRTAVADHVANAIATRTGFEFKAKLRRADGEVRDVASRGEYRVSKGGKAVLFGVFQDVTEQEAMLSQISQERDRAAAAAKAKAEFLANMSHELRTPLTGILGYTDVLLDREHDAASHRYLDLIREAGRSLLLQVNDVLDLSKFEANGVQLQCEPSDLSDIVRICADIVRPQAEGKGLILNVAVPETPVKAEVDPGRLRQVLMNLLSNAVKFTESGEVGVALRYAPAGPGRLAARIVVQDTGIGISAEGLDRIFDRFEQADGSITRRFGGSGLGLAISRAIVEAMGGGVEASSVPGQGSTFAITFEAVTTPVAVAPAPQPASQPATINLRGLKVLVAEDVAVNRELIRIFLGPHNVELVEVADGAQATAAAEAQAFDLIIMDMQMPVMDGLEATRRIRAGGGPSAHAPIMALTANVMAEQQENCLAAGMDSHLGKPFTARELASAVAAAVGRRAIAHAA